MWRAATGGGGGRQPPASSPGASAASAGTMMRPGDAGRAMLARQPTRKRHSVMSTFVRSSGAQGTRESVVIGQTLYRGHNSSVVFASFIRTRGPSTGAPRELHQSSTLLTIDDAGVCLIWPSTYDSNNGFGWVEPWQRYDVPLVLTDVNIRARAAAAAAASAGGPRSAQRGVEQPQHSFARSAARAGGASASAADAAQEHHEHRAPARDLDVFSVEKVESDEQYDHRMSIESRSTLWFLSYSWPKAKLGKHRGAGKSHNPRECIRHVVERRQDAYDPTRQEARIVSCLPDGQVLHKQRIVVESQEIRCFLSSACLISNDTELLLVLGMPRGFGLSQFRVNVMPIGAGDGVRTGPRSYLHVEDHNDIGSYSLLRGGTRISIDVGDYSNGAAPPCYAVWKTFFDSSGAISAVSDTGADHSHDTEILLFSLGCMRIGLFCLATGRMIRDIDLSDVVARSVLASASSPSSSSGHGTAAAAGIGGRSGRKAISECYGRHITHMSVAMQKVRIIERRRRTRGGHHHRRGDGDGGGDGDDGGDGDGPGDADVGGPGDADADGARAPPGRYQMDSSVQVLLLSVDNSNELIALRLDELRACE